MRHQDFIDIGRAADVRSFEAGLVRFAGAMDFGLVAAALVVEQAGQEPIFYTLGNTPQAFLDSFRSVEDSKRDPVLRRMRRSSVPFIYDQSLYVEEDAADLWEEQARFGYHTGVSVALHLPEHRHFLLGMDRRDALPADDRHLTRLMADLQLLAVHAQDAALRLLQRAPQPPSSDIHLTERELEVLRLTMAGHTAAAIAERLGISLPTVQWHIANVRHKLGASSKHQAVLKALSLGLL